MLSQSSSRAAPWGVRAAGAFQQPSPSSAARPPRRSSRGRRDAIVPRFARSERRGLPADEQAFAAAFRLADRDSDGRIDESEARRLFALAQALGNPLSPTPPLPPPPPPPPPPLHWDQHLARGIAEAHASPGGVAVALARFVCGKLSGGGSGPQRRRVLLSDVVWSALGIGAATAILASLAAKATTLPLVGPLHSAGLPLLLGSTGALCVLLFGRPDAEPVRLWTVAAGQLASAAIAVAVFKAFGRGVAAKALAMAAALAAMMRIDAVHPPGGALVLLALDNRGAQSLGWGLLLYPSLATTLLVVLPLALLTNVLKRRCAYEAHDLAEALRRLGGGRERGGGGTSGSTAAASKAAAALPTPNNAAKTTTTHDGGIASKADVSLPVAASS